MDITTTIKFLSLAATAIISLFCCLLIVINMLVAKQPEQLHPVDAQPQRKPWSTKILAIAAIMYFLISFSWFSSIIYFLYPKVFLAIHPILYVAMLYSMVLLYYMAFRITRTRKKDSFSAWHFVIPIILMGIVHGSSFIVPYEVQLGIVESGGKEYGNYKWFALLFTSKTLVFFIYNVIYSLLGLKRIKKFEKTLHEYTSDEGNSPARWLYVMFYISLASLPVLLLGSFIGMNPLYNTLFMLLPLFISSFQDIFICYNLIMANFEELEASITSSRTDKFPPRKKELARYELYKVVVLRKLFAKSDLRALEVQRELKVSHEELTSFIRHDYDLNFSQYVNRCRMREYVTMSNDKKFRDFNELKLIVYAGFSNKAAFRRTQKMLKKLAKFDRRSFNPTDQS